MGWHPPGGSVAAPRGDCGGERLRHKPGAHLPQRKGEFVDRETPVWIFVTQHLLQPGPPACLRLHKHTTMPSHQRRFPVIEASRAALTQTERLELFDGWPPGD
jgi:hypothetical protein